MHKSKDLQLFSYSTQSFQPRALRVTLSTRKARLGSLRKSVAMARKPAEDSDSPPTGASQHVPDHAPLRWLRAYGAEQAARRRAKRVARHAKAAQAAAKAAARAKAKAAKAAAKAAPKAVKAKAKTATAANAAAEALAHGPPGGGPLLHTSDSGTPPDRRTKAEKRRIAKWHDYMHEVQGAAAAGHPPPAVPVEYGGPPPTDIAAGVPRARTRSPRRAPAAETCVEFHYLSSGGRARAAMPAQLGETYGEVARRMWPNRPLQFLDLEFLDGREIQEDMRVEEEHFEQGAAHVWVRGTEACQCHCDLMEEIMQFHTGCKATA
jgi:hypothetical protein